MNDDDDRKVTSYTRDCIMVSLLLSAMVVWGVGVGIALSGGPWSVSLSLVAGALAVTFGSMAWQIALWRRAVRAPRKPAPASEESDGDSDLLVFLVSQDECGSIKTLINVLREDAAQPGAMIRLLGYIGRDTETMAARVASKHGRDSNAYTDAWTERGAAKAKAAIIYPEFDEATRQPDST